MYVCMFVCEGEINKTVGENIWPQFQFCGTKSGESNKKHRNWETFQQFPPATAWKSENFHFRNCPSMECAISSTPPHNFYATAHRGDKVRRNVIISVGKTVRAQPAAPWKMGGKNRRLVFPQRQMMALPTVEKGAERLTKKAMQMPFYFPTNWAHRKKKDNIENSRESKNSLLVPANPSYGS